MLKLPIKLGQAACAAVELQMAYRVLRRASIEEVLVRSGGRSIPPGQWSEFLEGCSPLPQLTASIERASWLMPKAHATCLIKSCAEARLRLRAGQRSILLIGFRSLENGKLVGHAWLAYAAKGAAALDRQVDGHTILAAFEMGTRG